MDYKLGFHFNLHSNQVLYKYLGGHAALYIYIYEGRSICTPSVDQQLIGPQNRLVLEWFSRGSKPVGFEWWCGPLDADAVCILYKISGCDCSRTSCLAFITKFAFCLSSLLVVLVPYVATRVRGKSNINNYYCYAKRKHHTSSY